MGIMIMLPAPARGVYQRILLVRMDALLGHARCTSLERTIRAKK